MQLTLAVGETDSQSSSLRLALADICGCVPHPATVTADVGAQLHVRDDYKRQHTTSLPITSKHRLTVVVSADLEGLVTAHHQAGLVVLGVPQQSHVTGTTLLPLLAGGVESEQLSAHLEALLLEFFVGLGLDFLGEADDGLEVNFGGFGSFLLLNIVLAYIQPHMKTMMNGTGQPAIDMTQGLKVYPPPHPTNTQHQTPPNPHNKNK